MEASNSQKKADDAEGDGTEAARLVNNSSPGHEDNDNARDDSSSGSSGDDNDEEDDNDDDDDNDNEDEGGDEDDGDNEAGSENGSDQSHVTVSEGSGSASETRVPGGLYVREERPDNGGNDPAVEYVVVAPLTFASHADLTTQLQHRSCLHNIHEWVSAFGKPKHP